MACISSTDFDKKCKIIVPKIEKELKEMAPNVKSVFQFFQLEEALRLNLRIEYEKEGEVRVLNLRVPAQQVMDDNLESVYNAIVKAVS